MIRPLTEFKKIHELQLMFNNPFVRSDNWVPAQGAVSAFRVVGADATRSMSTDRPGLRRRQRVLSHALVLNDWLYVHRPVAGVAPAEPRPPVIDMSRR